jgi:hypothetical protein
VGPPTGVIRCRTRTATFHAGGPGARCRWPGSPRAQQQADWSPGIREKAGDDGAVGRFHERTAERYAELLGHSKGALMKIGQLISTIDMGGVGTGGFAPYQKALIRLQSDAPPMAPTLVHEVHCAPGLPLWEHLVDWYPQGV